MQLILVRHAEAVDALSNDREADEVRELTETGKIQAQQLCDAFRQLKLQPTTIATSPLVRAKQTADALWSLLPAGQDLVVTDRLKIDELKPRKLSKEVVEFNSDCVILVGHMSDIGIYAAWLLGATDQIVKFAKGGAACFRVDDDEITEGSGTLEWFITPEWSRLLSEVTSR
jgi:phosphohistidine phosphatase